MKFTYVIVILFLTIPVSVPAVAQQFDLAGGYNYQNSDQGQDLRTDLNGWYASGQYDLNDRFALTLEADNYYGAVSGETERQQTFVSARSTRFFSKREQLVRFSMFRQAINAPRRLEMWNTPSICK